MENFMQNMMINNMEKFMEKFMEEFLEKFLGKILTRNPSSEQTPGSSVRTIARFKWVVASGQG